MCIQLILRWWRRLWWWWCCVSYSETQTQTLRKVFVFARKVLIIFIIYINGCKPSICAYAWNRRFHTAWIQQARSHFGSECCVLRARLRLLNPSNVEPSSNHEEALVASGKIPFPHDSIWEMQRNNERANNFHARMCCFPLALTLFFCELFIFLPFVEFFLFVVVVFVCSAIAIFPKHSEERKAGIDIRNANRYT